jgi:hypothetical protein
MLNLASIWPATSRFTSKLPAAWPKPKPRWRLPPRQNRSQPQLECLGLLVPHRLLPVDRLPRRHPAVHSGCSLQHPIPRNPAKLLFSAESDHRVDS